MTEEIEQRDIDEGYWFWVNRQIFDEYAAKIGVMGFAIYCAYSYYASFYKGDNGCWASQKQIASRLGITIPTVSKYNKILKKNGLIHLKSGKELGRSNYITLLRIIKDKFDEDDEGE